MKTTIYWAKYLNAAMEDIALLARKIDDERRAGKKINWMMTTEELKDSSRFWIEKSKLLPGPKLP